MTASILLGIVVIIFPMLGAAPARAGFLYDDLLVGSDTSAAGSAVLSFDHAGVYRESFVAPGAGLITPRGLAIGPDGQLYVSSFSDGRVLRFDGTSGAFVDTFVTQGSGGLLNPEKLIFAGGALLVSDWGAGAVRSYDAATGASNGDLIAPGVAGLSQPDDMIFGPDGKLYVSSTGTGEVLRFTATGGFDRVFASGNGLIFPRGLVFDAQGKLLVADSDAGRVLRFRADGTYDGVFAEHGMLEAPRGLIYAADGDLIITDYFANAAGRFDAQGTFVKLAASGNGLTEPAYSLTPLPGPGLALDCPLDRDATPGSDVMLSFCIDNVGTVADSFAYQLIEPRLWRVGSPVLSGCELVAPGGQYCLALTLHLPAGCAPGDADDLVWLASPKSRLGHGDSCATTVTCTSPTPTLVSRLEAEAGETSAEIRYALADEHGLSGVHIYRALDGVGGVRVTGAPIATEGRESYRFTDRALEPGRTYVYRLGLIERDGSEVRAGEVTLHTLAPSFALRGPFPNPARAGLTIELSAAVAGNARVRLLDPAGRRVGVIFDGPLTPGSHRLIWDGKLEAGRPVAAGIYFVVYEAAGRRAITRAVIVR